MTSPIDPPRLGVAAYWNCFVAIVWREMLRFLHQRERFLSALVRPLVWLFIFAAGFRATLGVSIIPPYQSYVLDEEFVTPGLVGMIQLFNAMQSSLTMVYDRETGAMRTLLISPFPRSFLLTSKLIGGVVVSLLQVYVFMAICYVWEVRPPHLGYLAVLPALVLSGLMLGAFALFISSVIKQLENFAGVMNFVIFPMFFASSALYPLWRIRGVERSSLRHLSSQSVHLCGRTDPLRALRRNQRRRRAGRCRLHGRISWTGHSGVQSIQGTFDPARSAGRRGKLMKRLSWCKLLCALFAATPCVAAEPDWPCVQRRVETLTASQMWDGRPVDDLTSWDRDDEVRRLVELIASRRNSAEDSAQRIKAFAEAQPADARDEKLKLVFAGALSVINSDRTAVIHGIERFQRKQHERSLHIKRQGAELAALRVKAASDTALAERVRDMDQRLAWDERVFQERQQSIPFACEIPVLIEQRLFDLAREIRTHMKE